LHQTITLWKSEITKRGGAGAMLIRVFHWRGRASIWGGRINDGAKPEISRGGKKIPHKVETSFQQGDYFTGGKINGGKATEGGGTEKGGCREKSSRRSRGDLAVRKAHTFAKTLKRRINARGSPVTRGDGHHSSRLALMFERGGKMGRGNRGADQSVGGGQVDYRAIGDDF